MSKKLILTVQSISGATKKTIELPESIFNARISIPLMHQVVTAQLAAARQGTHAVKNRHTVSGGGKKPYRQKGTGRARQGSIRAPQFTGGAVAHGPVPRSYAQRTPKKMISAALYGALSDRAQNSNIIVIDSLVPQTDAAQKLTQSAQKFLHTLAVQGRILLVLNREDELAKKAVANLQTVHSISQDQLNTYDVLKADTVIFSEDALNSFIAARTAQEKVDA